MSELQSVIVTCAASLVIPSTLASLQAVGQTHYRFIGVDANHEPLALTYLAEFYQVPLALHADYVPKLLEIVAKTQAKYLLVLSDIEAQVLTAPVVRAQFLANGCELLLPHHDVVMQCVDKGNFLQFLQADPRTAERFCQVDSVDDLIQSAETFDYPHNTFIVKTRTGCGSRGIMLVDASATRKDLLLSRDYKRFDLAFLQEAFAQEKQLNLLAMPYYAGDDYNIDVLCQAGRVVYCLIQRRVAPKMGAIMTAEVVDDAEITELVTHLVERLQVTGLINIEVARDLVQGKVKVYEINPRPSAAFAFLCYQGIDILAELIAVFKGQTLVAKAMKPMTIKRVWSQLYTDE